MQKKLIALAVAGAMFAPVAMADTANVTMYGVLHMSVDNMNAANVAANSDNKSWNVSNNSSRMGFKGMEDLGNGLKFNWQWEGAVAMEETAAGSFGTNLRNSYMGLSGTWGEVRFGRHDTPYKLADGKARAMFDDTVGDYGTLIGAGVGAVALGQGGVWEARVDNAMAYISPTWGGFHFAAASSFYNTAGATPAGQDGNKQKAYSLAGIYANGPFNVGFGYETRKDTTAAASAASDDAKAYKLALGYTQGNLEANFVYENQKADNGGAGTFYRNHKIWGLNGGYKFGNNRVIAQYVKANDSSFNSVERNDDARLWSLGLEHTLSKRTNVYVVYSSLNQSDAGTAGLAVGAGHGDVLAAAATVAGYDPKAFSIGMRHSF